MRQIGARQESAKVGGIGSCGRELCCSTWLTDFKSVNTTAARYQNLSINQTKLSGQCGRLKCCLNYELDTYMDALRVFPDNAESIQTIQGTASLQKKDIFKNLMWYSYSDSNKQYPMSIERVKEIVSLNKQGIKPEELQPVELDLNVEKKGVKVDVGFVNDVGQISLRALEKSSKKKKGGNDRNRQGDKQQQGGRPQQNAGGNQQQKQQNAPQGRNQPQGDRPQKPQQQGGGGRPQQQGNKTQQPKQPKQEGQQPQRQQQPKQQQGGNPNQQPKQAQGGNPGQQPKQPQGDKQPQQQRPPRQQAGGEDLPGNNNQQRNRPPRPPRPPRGEKPQQENKPQPPAEG
jgi:hypothetical protein